MSALAMLLIEQRKKAESEYRALLDSIEKRDGATASPTAEEVVVLDRLGAAMDDLRSQSDRLVKFEADSKAAEETLRELGHGREEKKTEVDINAQFRALYNREVHHIELRSTQTQFEEARALSKGTATAGGNTVPTDFVSRLYEHMIETATLLRGGATVLNTTSGENIEMPVTTSHGTAALVAESGTIPQADPAFAKRTLGAYKYGDLILVPNELLNDTAVDLTGYLARMAGRAVGNALGTDLVVGNGSSKPSGIFQTSTLGKTGATGVVGVPTWDELIDLLYSVIAPYRNSPDAAWLIKDTTAGALRKLKDSSGRYVWEASVIPGTPDSFLGHPVYTDPNVAATGLGAKSVIFGDLSAYYVRLVNGVRFERSDDFKFDVDQVAFRCLIRGDGLLVDQSGAVKHYIGGAS